MVEEIKKLIGDGKTKEALASFSSFTSDENHPLYNDSILLSSRYNKLTIEFYKANISNQDLISETNKISEMLLKLLDANVLVYKSLEVKEYKNQKSGRNSVEYLSIEQKSRNYREAKQKFELYISKIIELKETYYKFAKFGWNTGKTSSMNNASKDIIELYEDIINKLSEFYPQDHFTETPKTYFNGKIVASFDWHRKVFETEGIGLNGTIVSTMVRGSVIHDLDQMIQDIIIALSLKYDVDLTEWKEKWNKK